MKATTLIGIILIVLGVIGLAYGGITYTSARHEVDIGPLEATVEEKDTLPIPPVAGGIAVIAGLVLIAVGKKGS